MFARPPGATGDEIEITCTQLSGRDSSWPKKVVSGPWPFGTVVDEAQIDGTKTEL